MTQQTIKESLARSTKYPRGSPQAKVLTQVNVSSMLYISNPTATTTVAVTPSSLLLAYLSASYMLLVLFPSPLLHPSWDSGDFLVFTKFPPLPKAGPEN